MKLKKLFQIISNKKTSLNNHAKLNHPYTIIQYYKPLSYEEEIKGAWLA